MSSSLVNDFAIFLNTSGAILGTCSQYSPISHRILARAIGTCRQFGGSWFHALPADTAWGVSENLTWMLSVSFAMCLMMSLCFSGCICRSFLITTTDSATTSSAGGHTRKPSGLFSLLISVCVFHWVSLLSASITKLHLSQVSLFTSGIQNWWTLSEPAAGES